MIEWKNLKMKNSFGSRFCKSSKAKFHALFYCLANHQEIDLKRYANRMIFARGTQQVRHWKDIYQRIFISHILSKNREKGYVGYVKGYNILILGIYKFLYPIQSYILFRKN
jgi:hypothetical protein